MNAITDYKDGWLTIREVENLSNEPVQMTTWWPVLQDSRASLESLDLLAKEVFYESGGVYSIRIAPYQYRKATLTNGGQTKPLCVVSVQLETPKVRKGVEVRYRNGRFEKYLKSEGWVVI